MRENTGQPPNVRTGRYHDVRDDYDDEFSRSWSPSQIARRRVFAVAVAFLVIGIIGVLGMVTTAVVIGFAWLHGSAPLDEVGIYLWLALVGCCLFALVFAGGMCLMRLRRYGVVLAAAYCLTGLSVIGVYAILFFPFGIWALILLYRPDVRAAFCRSTDV